MKYFIIILIFCLNITNISAQSTTILPNRAGFSSNTNQPAIIGTNSANGRTAIFQNTNSTNPNTVLDVANYGLSTTSFFTSYNTSSVSPIIYCEGIGQNSGLHMVLSNTSNTNPTIFTTSNGLGNGASLFLTNSGNTNAVVYGSTNGNGGKGLQAIATGNGAMGVYATVTGNFGTAVHADASNATNGLAIVANGFSKFGGLSNEFPSIKIKRIVGSTSQNDGGLATIAHGLSDSQIVDVRVLVEWDSISGGVVHESYTVNSGYQFNYSTGSGNVYIYNIPGNCVNILNKPVRILITYMPE
ncbi:MAG TPA: hypothetical protein VK175_19085 [Leadbetterella sp.]|nr:hypothetical protein [Leadbetterella sp.]